MPGKLPRPTPAPLGALDALLSATAPAPFGGRLPRLLFWAFLVDQVVLLAVVRSGDGDKAVLEGGAARTLTVALWLRALPLALAAARHGRELLDEGVASLAALRGVAPAVVAQRATRAPLTALVRALTPALVVAGVWPLVLSAGDGAAALARKLSVLALLCALAVLAGVGLVSLGRWVGQRASSPRRAMATLAALLLGPWLAVRLVDAPRMLSLPGLYRAAVDAVLRLAS